MTHRNTRAALVVLAATAFSGSAGAATLDLSLSQLNGNVVRDVSGPGQISVDIDFVSDTSVTLAYVIEAGDGPTLAVEGLFQNFLQEGWQNLSISLGNGATWTGTGDVSGDFSVATASLLDAARIDVLFSGPEFSGLEFGAVAGGFNTADWLIDASAFAPGSVIELTIAPTLVPLPAGVWLLLSAIGALGLARHRD